MKNNKIINSPSLSNLLKELPSKHTYFKLSVSRYNAIGGDMWDIHLEHGDITRAPRMGLPTIASTSLDLEEAAGKVLRRLCPKKYSKDKRNKKDIKKKKAIMVTKI